VLLLRLLGRAALIVTTACMCAIRVHASASDVPSIVAEVNRCLRMIHVAASRKGRALAPPHVAKSGISAQRPQPPAAA
jgi:hypothetical protein